MLRAGGTALRGIIDKLLRELKAETKRADGTLGGWQEAAAAAVTVLIEARARAHLQRQ